MDSIRHSMRTATLTALLAAVLLLTDTPTASAQAHDDGFDEQYIFATTKAVNNMQEVNPALKLTIYPVTVVLDTVFLPFAVIAGFVG